MQNNSASIASMSTSAPNAGISASASRRAAQRRPCLVLPPCNLQRPNPDDPSPSQPDACNPSPAGCARRTTATRDDQHRLSWAVRLSWATRCSRVARGSPSSLGLCRPAVAGEDQLAPLDLEGDLVRVDARELGVQHRTRRGARAPRAGGGPPQKKPAPGGKNPPATTGGELAGAERLAEQLVHFAAH